MNDERQLGDQVPDIVATAASAESPTHATSQSSLPSAVPPSDAMDTASLEAELLAPLAAPSSTGKVLLSPASLRNVATKALTTKPTGAQGSSEPHDSPDTSISLPSEDEQRSCSPAPTDDQAALGGGSVEGYERRSKRSMEDRGRRHSRSQFRPVPSISRPSWDQSTPDAERIVQMDGADENTRPLARSTSGENQRAPLFMPCPSPCPLPSLKDEIRRWMSNRPGFVYLMLGIALGILVLGATGGITFVVIRDVVEPPNNGTIAKHPNTPKDKTVFEWLDDVLDLPKRLTAIRSSNVSLRILRRQRGGWDAPAWHNTTSLAAGFGSLSSSYFLGFNFVDQVLKNTTHKWDLQLEIKVNGDAAVATYNDVQFNFSVANDGNGLLAFESVDQEALADLIRSLPLIDSASNVDKRKGSNIAQHDAIALPLNDQIESSGSVILLGNGDVVHGQPGNYSKADKSMNAVPEQERLSKGDELECLRRPLATIVFSRHRCVVCAKRKLCPTEVVLDFLLS